MCHSYGDEHMVRIDNQGLTWHVYEIWWIIVAPEALLNTVTGKLKMGTSPFRDISSLFFDIYMYSNSIRLKLFDLCMFIHNLNKLYGC